MLNFYRNIKFPPIPQTVRLRHYKKNNDCDETDCCGKRKYPDGICNNYLEKDCELCNFKSWKPRIPKLCAAPAIKKPLEPHENVMCTPGMLPPKDICVVKKEAAVCRLKCKAEKPKCVKPPPPPPPPPVPKERHPLPEADWDMDGKC